MNHTEFIRENVIRDMSEGIMTIGLDGIIENINPAAAKILEKSEKELLGKRFAGCFFEYEENDSFNQMILDAVYDTSTTHKNVVTYFTGSETKYLHVTTSYLHNGETKVGIIAVLSDISELVELRDAVKAMNKIRALNTQLELRNKLLSETFGRYLSDEIVRQLLDTPDGLTLGGKKRTLTIMMSDLRGFTAHSECMEAHALISMLNNYLEKMTEIIQKHNGTIIEFIGDGILAIYGAPVLSEHHADDAVCAAVEMQTAMNEINKWNIEQGYPKLEMGIGIHSGEVIVGNIGSEKRTKYGVVGNHVNVCGRVESYTVGGQIFVSQGAKDNMKAELIFEQSHEVYPKGVKKALVLYQTVGIGVPYNLSCAESYDELTELRMPVSVPYYMIADKHCDPVPQIGMITAISEKEAIFTTEADIKAFDNIRMDIGGELFCKILYPENNGWRIRFTSFPTKFKNWYGEVVNNK